MAIFIADVLPSAVVSILRIRCGRSCLRANTNLERINIRANHVSDEQIRFDISGLIQVISLKAYEFLHTTIFSSNILSVFPICNIIGNQ